MELTCTNQKELRGQMTKQIVLLLLIAASSSLTYAKDKKEKANKNWIEERDTVMFEVLGKGEATKQESWRTRANCRLSPV